MGIDFPSTPTEGQEFTPSPGVTFVYVVSRWSLKPNDAPSDNKLYGRKNATWAEVISDVTKAYVDAEVAKQVAATGDTMTGPLTITMDHGSLVMNATATDGINNFQGQRNGVGRWLIQMPDGNAAGHFGIWRYNDAGAIIDCPLSINRATALVTTVNISSGYVTTTTQLTASGPNGALAFRINETGSGYNKYLRVNNIGTLEVVNHANNAILMGLTDAGALSSNTFNTNGITATSLSFANIIAPGGPTDLSRHISLYGGSYGFSVTSGTLNLVAAGARAAWFDGNASFQGSCYSANGRLWGTSDFSAPMPLAGGTMTGRIYPQSSTGAIGWDTHVTGIEVRGAGGGYDAAFISFHRPSAYATFFGLDYDNQFAWGGWSAGQVRYRFWTEANLNPGLYMPISGGTFTGAIHTNSTLSTSGNLWVYGGVLYVSAQGHYIQWDGSKYVFPHGGLWVQDQWVARQNTDNTFNTITSNNGIYSTGYRFRNGIYGAYGGNWYNTGWPSGGSIEAWVDATSWGWIATSCDYRFKKNVRPLESMWEKVKNLRPIRYSIKDWSPPVAEVNQKKLGKPMIVADDVERWGFFAHELQETLTHTAASGTKDSHHEVQSPNNISIIAALAKALQEAMSRIEQLEERISHA